MTDSNGDGIPDGFHTWGTFASNGWGDKKHIDTFVYGPVATDISLAVTVSTDTPDSDGDGISDEQEYADGTWPEVVVEEEEGGEDSSSSGGSSSRTSSSNDSTAKDVLLARIAELQALLATLQADSGVMQAPVTTLANTNNCPFFTQHMALDDEDGKIGSQKQEVGVSNILDEVALLQAALTKQGIYTGPVTGYFGNLTDAAVRKWQTSHRVEVLDPWGLTGPTGKFYQSSERWMNELLGCEDTVVLDNGVSL